MKKPSVSLSRRAVLGASALAAGAAVLPGVVTSKRLSLFVPAKPALAEAGSLLAKAIEQASSRRWQIDVVPVKSRSRQGLLAVVNDAPGDVLLSFVGAQLAQALAEADPHRQLLSLSFGARFDPLGIKRVKPVRLELCGALEAGGRWAARALGPRAASVSMGSEIAFDSVSAFAQGVASSGGQMAVPEYASATDFLGTLERAADDADVVLALASGEHRNSLWRAVKRLGLGPKVVVHPFAISPDAMGSGAHLITGWGVGDAFSTLARRAVSVLDGQPLEPARFEAWSLASNEPEPIATLRSDDLIASRALSPSTLRSGSSEPYTGC